MKRIKKIRKLWLGVVTFGIVLATILPIMLSLGEAQAISNIFPATYDSFTRYWSYDYSTVQHSDCINHLDMGSDGCQTFDSAKVLNVGQAMDTIDRYQVNKAQLTFATDVLPNNAIITSVALELYYYLDNAVTADFDVVAQINGIYAGSVNTSALVLGKYNSILVNTSMVNKQGNTFISLTSSRIESGTLSYLECVWFNSSESSDSPKLNITWSE